MGGRPLERGRKHLNTAPIGTQTVRGSRHPPLALPSAPMRRAHDALTQPISRAYTSA